jgi:hypothetical protein
VVDPAINTLRPAVRALLGQAPATIRDEYDPNSIDWPAVGQFDMPWIDDSIHAHLAWDTPLDPANPAFMPEVHQPLAVPTEYTNYNSTAFQRAKCTPCSGNAERDGMALSNGYRCRSDGGPGYTSQDESYIDSRVQAQLLLFRAQLLQDLSVQSMPTVSSVGPHNRLPFGGQNQPISPARSQVTEISECDTAKHSIPSEIPPRNHTED